eukprot:1825533-Amphidinium_carterae.1
MLSEDCTNIPNSAMSSYQIGPIYLMRKLVNRAISRECMMIFELYADNAPMDGACSWAPV